MSDPLITPDDLGTYLSDRGIDTDRATMMISYAQALCEAVVSPLPAAAAVVVARVAARGYVTVLSSRNQQLGEAGSPYGHGGSSGVYLTQEDRDDLASVSGRGGGAFTVDMLPAGHQPNLPPWDLDGGTCW